MSPPRTRRAEEESKTSEAAAHASDPTPNKGLGAPKSDESDETGNRDGVNEFGEESRRLVRTGQRLAETWIENRKAAVSSRLHETAAGLRRFGETFDAEPNLRDYIAAAADGLDDASIEIGRHDVREMIEGAEDYTRDRPIAVFGVALVAGVLLSRVLRSGMLSERA